jgi:hypothetical protein
VPVPGHSNSSTTTRCPCFLPPDPSRAACAHGYRPGRVAGFAAVAVATPTRCRSCRGAAGGPSDSDHRDGIPSPVASKTGTQQLEAVTEDSDCPPAAGHPTRSTAATALRVGRPLAARRRAFKLARDEAGRFRCGRDSEMAVCPGGQVGSCRATPSRGHH